MAKIYNSHRFGTTPNSLLNNPLISLKAKGLYAYMDSKPETWDFTIKGIVSQVKESFESVRAAIKELEESRYLSKEQFKNEKGQWDCDYTLYPDPILNTSGEKPYRGFPYTGQPYTESSVTVKPLCISKKEISKKEEGEKEEGEGEGGEKIIKKEEGEKEITDWDILEENLDEVLQGIARMFCFTGLFNQPNYFFDKFELRTEFNQAKAYYKQKDKQSRVKSDPATKLISWFKTNKSISEPSLDYTQIKQMSEQDEIAHDLAELNKFTQTMKTYA